MFINSIQPAGARPGQDQLNWLEAATKWSEWLHPLGTHNSVTSFSLCPAPHNFLPPQPICQTVVYNSAPDLLCQEGLIICETCRLVYTPSCASVQPQSWTAHKLRLSSLAGPAWSYSCHSPPSPPVWSGLLGAGPASSLSSLVAVGLRVGGSCHPVHSASDDACCGQDQAVAS